jgi:predicted MPP superfamily phosphohydrolase
MSRFLIFYFVVYGGAHLYFLFTLKRAFRMSTRVRTLITACVTTLFLAPLIARKLETSGFDLLPELLANCGYLWMGLLFLFISSAALLEFVNLLLTRSRLKISARALFQTAIAYSLAIGCYGYFEARNIVTEHLTIKSNRIPQRVSRVRIVQISDLHIGQIVREQRIKAVIAAIKTASPDILVSTGDLVDGHQRHFSGLERLFLEVTPRLGKYAVLGNHEYYVGAEDSERFIKNSGFNLLKNENFELGGIISITGVDDSRNTSAQRANALIEARLLKSAATGGFRLLLKHRPVLAKNSEGLFDLQLSGHVHKGQIFPFNVLTWLSFPVRAGLTQLESGGNLYVSRGTGVWGPPIRFLAAPEITVIDLLPEAGFTKKN